MSRQSAGGAAGGGRSAPGTRQAIESLEPRVLLSAATPAGATAAGGADLAFGQNGQALVGVPVSRDDRTSTLAVTADGRVIVAGASARADGPSEAIGEGATVFARFAADGRADAAFSDDGQAAVDLGDLTGYGAAAVYPTADGGFLFSIEGYESRVVGRARADGSLDTAFGSGGLVRTEGFHIGAAQFAALPDGGFLVVTGYNQTVIVRYAADGTRLGDFASGDFSTTPVIAVQPDGRVLVGTGLDGVRRLMPDGSPDRSFGRGKNVPVRIPGVSTGDTALEQLLPTADGKVVALLRAYSSGQSAAASVRRLTAAGKVDKTFAGGGAIDTGVRGYAVPIRGNTVGQDYAPKAVVQPDGGVVVLGRRGGGDGAYPTPTLARVTPAGTLDAAFGYRSLPDGLVATDVAAGPGGSIVVAATRIRPEYTSAGTPWSDFEVVRFAADGSTDAAFGDGGRAVADFKVDVATATAAAAAPDGKTVVVGYLGGAYYAAPDGSFVARINPDGSLDSTFGDGGIVREAAAPGTAIAPSAVVVRPDGKVVVGRSAREAGRTDRDFTLTGYNADGTLDVSFGYGGTVHTDLGTHTDDKLNALLLQPDGKIVAGGGAGRNLFALVRYGTDGRPDFSFGHFGEALAGFANNAGVDLGSLARTPDGRIVAVGLAHTESDGGDDPNYDSTIAVARYLPDGRPDPTFGRRGRAAVGHVYGRAEPARVFGSVLLPDGSLVVGHDGNLYSQSFGLSRIDSAGRYDASFAAAPDPAASWTTGARAFAMAAGGDGAIYVGGVFTGVASASPEGFVFARASATDGAFDPTFGGTGTVKTLFNPGGEPTKATFAALLPTADGKLLGVGSVNTADGRTRVAVARYATDGAPPATLPPGAGPAERVPLPFGGLLVDLYFGASVAAAGDRVVYGVAGGGGGVDGVWATDGTPGGTRRVAGVQPEYFQTVGGLAYFFVADPEHPYEGPYDLWRSDGTADGTYKLAGGVVLERGASDVGVSQAAIGDTFYFVAADGPEALPGEAPPRALWRTDGTPVGTRVVRPGFAYDLRVAGPTLFFRASDVFNESRLWATDGTPGGSHPVGGDAAYSPIGLGDGVVVFTQYDEAHGYELWRNDGTPGSSRLVADLTPGTAGTGIEFLAAANGRVFFATNDQEFSGVRDRFWSTDGTAEGTVLLGGQGRFPVDQFSGTGVTVVGDRMYYLVDSWTSNDVELWASDGTPAGTRLVRAFAPAPDDGSSRSRNAPDPYTFTPFGDRLLFVAGSDDGGREVWVTDGTPAGTRQLRDVMPGPGGFPGGEVSDQTPPIATAIGSTAYFAADDGVRGTELWATDGTPAGTRLVADLNPGVDGSNPHDFVRAGDKVYFTAADDVGGQSAWVMSAGA